MKTVRELIAELQKHSPDAVILIRDINRPIGDELPILDVIGGKKRVVIFPKYSKED